MAAHTTNGPASWQARSPQLDYSIMICFQIGKLESPKGGVSFK